MLQKSNQVIFIHSLVSVTVLLSQYEKGNMNTTNWMRRGKEEKQELIGGTLNEIKLSYHFILCFYLSFFSFSPFFSLSSNFQESHVDFHHHVFTHYKLSMCLLLWMLLFFLPLPATILGYSVKYTHSIRMHLWSAIQTYHVSHIHISFFGIEKPLKLFFSLSHDISVWL